MDIIFRYTSTRYAGGGGLVHKKVFVDYKQFLFFAMKHIDELKNIEIVDNMLLKYCTKSYRCSYPFDTGNMTPSAFCRELGIQKYSSFVFCFFSKLKDFAENDYDVSLWKNGFFGGLIGLNYRIANKYLGTGEINEFYDYDINSAYLTALTDFLPSKFVKKISYEEYSKLKEIDKIPYYYFFDVTLPYWQGDYNKLIMEIRPRYKYFDFLQSKQSEHMIISEKRLNLIKQIYFAKDIVYGDVYIFERHKASIYTRILAEYLKQKGTKPKAFKKNALKLYGCLGKIYNKKISKIDFTYLYNEETYYYGEDNYNNVYIPRLIEECGWDIDYELSYSYERSINWTCSPQVSMWVADSIAEKLFNIIDTNYDSIISWNTDGLTSIKPLNLKIGKRGGQWKTKKIVGMPLLQTESSTHVFYYDYLTSSFIGADSMIMENGNIYQIVNTHKSSIKYGYETIENRYTISPKTAFNPQQTFRYLLKKEKLLTEVLYEREYRTF